MPDALCLCAWAAAAEPVARPPLGLVSRVGQITALAVIAACPVLAVHMLTLYPGRAGSGRATAVVALMLTTFGAQLVTYALLAVRRCEPLGAWRGAGVPGLAAALVVGGVFQLSQPPGGLSSYLAYPTVNPPMVAATFAAPVAAGALAVLLVRPARGLGLRMRSGAGEMVWGWLLCRAGGVITSIVATPRSAIAAEAAEPVISAEARQQGATSVLAWVSSDDLGGAIVMFAVLSTASLLIFLMTHALSKDHASRVACPASGDSARAPG